MKAATLTKLMSQTPTPERLASARGELGLSQQALADQLGLSRVMISNMETGDKPIERRTWLSVILLLVAHGAVH